MAHGEEYSFESNFGSGKDGLLLPEKPEPFLDTLLPGELSAAFMHWRCFGQDLITITAH